MSDIDLSKKVSLDELQKIKEEKEQSKELIQKEKERIKLAFDLLVCPVCKAKLQYEQTYFKLFWIKIKDESFYKCSENIEHFKVVSTINSRLYITKDITFAQYTGPYEFS